MHSARIDASDTRWWSRSRAVALLVLLAACGSSQTAATTAEPPAAVVTGTPHSAEAVPPVTSASAPPATAEPEPAEASPTTTAPVAAIDPAAGVATGDRLRDRTFRSISVSEHGRPKGLVAGSTVKVQFEARPESDGVRWRAGCNTAGASVTITADQLRLGPDVGSTAMGCAPEHEEQDQWVADFFLRDPSWHVDGSRLFLSAGETVIELEEVAADAFHG